ncbi:MAG TPA: hypothetical protein DDW93_11765 [Firmicutes bacterium]|jgi:AcrR family transcriptional regulator|nr:hypothetical protein [Bacillota bacterium]HBK68590.1 hypothetical protein [Bacillota bacterium]HBT16797.1 hypothetical protein [Bacillota bacterium]
MTTSETHPHSPSPETKERILASALAIFGEKGYHNATMAEIAEDANVGKGTLYWYFSSKEDLFSGMIEQGIQTLNGKLQSILGDHSLTFSQLLVEFNREYLHYFYDHRQLARLFLSNHSGLSSKFHDRMFQWHTDFVKVNNDIIQRGLKTGLFRPDLEVDWVATAFTGIISAFGNRQFLGDNQEQIEAEALFIYNLMVDGIGIKDEGDKSL